MHFPAAATPVLPGEGSTGEDVNSFAAVALRLLFL